MRKGKMMIVTAFCCVLLASCGNKTALPDLSSMGDVTVVSREEGSGTKAEFERMVGTDGSGTKEIAASTDEVLELVADDKNAVGYAAYSSVLENEDLKIISVDGTTISEKNIKKNQYALCRNYYLAYSGELSDAENDFFSYVLSAGQDIVADTCLAVKSSGTFLSDQSEGTIVINGSSSVAPVMEALIRDYKTYNPNVEFELQVTDSTTGLTAAMRGECDLAMCSRELESYEDELLTKTAIGADAIAVIVNAQNPVDDLSKKQLKDLYDGACGAWKDIR